MNGNKQIKLNTHEEFCNYIRMLKKLQEGKMDEFSPNIVDTYNCIKQMMTNGRILKD